MFSKRIIVGCTHRMWRFRRISTVTGVCLLSCLLVNPWDIARASSEPGSSSNTSEAVLRLQELLPELLRVNPELRAAQKRYEASLTRAPQESALPDPKLTFGWISNGAPLPGFGLGSEPTSNIGFQLSQEFPYPGKRSLKESIAKKASGSQAQEYRALQLNLIWRLKLAFQELRFSYGALDILSRNRSVLRRLSEAVAYRYSIGKASQQDLIRSQLEISILEKRVLSAEQKKQGQEAEINELLNRPVRRRLPPPEPAPALPELVDEETMQRRMSEAAPVLRFQRELIDQRHFGMQLAQKEYYPDFEVMSGYYNMGGLKDMWEFKLRVNVPVFFWHKQRPGLEEASLRLTEAQKSYQAIQQNLAFKLHERHLAAETARKLSDLYSQRLLPQAQLALESGVTGYEAGSADFVTVLQNFNSILDSELGSLEQQTEYLKALAGLEELMASASDLSDSGEVQP